MAKRPTLADGREWMLRGARGESYAQMALALRRDVRTVRKWVRRAERARDLEAVHKEVLKDAYTRHHQDLLDVLVALAETLRAALMPLGLRYPDSMEPAAVEAAGCEVRDLGAEIPAVVFGREHSLEWALLREHLAGDPLWGSFDRWKHCVGGAASRHLQLFRLIPLALEGAELEIGRSEGCVLPAAVDLIYTLAARSATEGEPELRDAASRLRDHPHEARIRLGGAEMLAYAAGADSPLGELKEAFGVVADAGAIEALRKIHGELVEAGREAASAAEEILAAHFVTGRCRVCRRLGA